MASEDFSASYGIKPFVFRDQWHFFKFPFVMYGSFPSTHFWEQCPDDSVLQTLTDIEKGMIGAGAQLGLDAYFTINAAFFSNRPWPLHQDILFRLVMARTDLYTTVALLKFLPNELWNALYHGHQSAEKSLKALLIARGLTDRTLRREHRHDLATLLERCAGFHPVFAERAVLLPHMKWDNDWRYTPYAFPKQQVVSMFDCAMILLADVVHALLQKDSGNWPSQVLHQPLK